MYKIIILIILIQFISYKVHEYGKNEYKEKNNKIHDVMHNILPDQHDNKPLSYLIDIMAIIPFFIGNEKYLEYIPTIFLIRALFSIVTILPKHEHCDDSEYTLKNILYGHCHDKIFSGHFAITFLLSLVLYNANPNNKVLFVGLVFYNLIYAILILLVRSHYTIDILVSIVVTSLIYTNKWKLI